MADCKVYEDLSYDDVNTRRIKFVWKITDFSTRKEIMSSALFPTSAPENLGNWSLELNPNDKSHNNSGRCLTIILYEESLVVTSAAIKIYLMDENGEARERRFAVFENGSAGCVTLTGSNFVLNKANGFLPNDELTIVCDIEIPVHSRCPSLAKCEPPPCRLAEDWGNLLGSRFLSDVTIVVGGAELRAHKVVLAARSPVFAAMFSNQMLEKETSVVEITDMDADVVQEMLEFMYTGKEISQTSSANDLLAAATKYQLERLKFMCEVALCKALTVDNVLENLALADLYNAPMLKEQSISFAMARKSAVLRSSSWETFKLSHQSLVLEILEKNCLQDRFNFVDYSNDVMTGE